MKQRFETFVTAILQINRSIQRLKTIEMADLGLKGTHVMCLFQLQQHPEGMTAVQLAQACEEDKAAVSRTLAELRELGLADNVPAGGRRYRVPITLTQAGREATDRMSQKIVDSVSAAARGYTPQERETFYRVLLQVSENLQQACTALSQEDPT